MASKSKEKALAVPKFSSFKPKPTLPQDQAKQENELKRAKDDERPSSRKGHTHPRDRSLSTSTIDESHRSTGNHQAKLAQRPTPQGYDRDVVFVYDRRGDPLIRRYGSNDRRNIPEYRRFGFGRILGVDGHMRIDRSGSNDKFFLRGYHDSRSLLSGDRKSILAKGGRLKSRPVRVRREPSQTVPGSEDFVPLRSSKKRKRGHVGSEESSGEERPSYRSIHGKSKNHEHSDSDIEYDSDSSLGSTARDEEDPVKLKSIELSRKVRDHPDNIDAWLQLVDHQDTLLRINGDGGRRPTTAEVKSFADIKLSMLGQAYFHAHDNSQREKLEVRIMREGSKIWDYKTLSKRWDEAMKKHATSFEIWRAFTSFQQTSLSTFQYDDIKQLYIARLRWLEKEAPADSLQFYEQMIYVFLRATRFISDAGFGELATAAWQAALELTFARPSSVAQQFEGRLPPSFQDFWESEVPRIGEESSQGWATFERDGGIGEPSEPKTCDAVTPPSTRDGYKAWSVIEQQKSRNATVPVRTMDDGAEDDPFRVIMFADIQDLLFYIPAEAIPKVQHHLLDAFLIFCQLPPAFCSSSVIQDALRDDFLIRSSEKPFTETFPKAAESTANFDGQTSRSPQFSHDYLRMSITPSTLFPVPHWFRSMNRIRDIVPAGQYHWISATLKQLVRTFGVGDLAPYYLAFESINEPGNEKKTAKALLKQDPMNIDLYMGYSILEWAKGNKAAAVNVFIAAVGLQAIPVHDRFRLGIASAWMELEESNLTKSILQLCTLSEDTSSGTLMPQSPAASSAQILKTRQLLASNRDYLLSSGDSEHAVIYAEGFALLEYLTRQSDKEPSSGNQGDIWSAISSISACSGEFTTRGLGSSPAHERLLQFAARLLYYHARQGPFRPGFLREQLTKYINFFPQNTIFLSLFAWREARLSIDDRVRSILDKTVLVEAHDCVSSRVFAIQHELQTGNVHSTRATFEHALESEACKNHPGLWVSYIRFCYDGKELRPKTKDVFYRALQHCPWSKEVFMEAFITLVKDMDSLELKSVYHTLCEKGLRVHVEMEEFVETWRREQKESGMTRR
ncbi:DUF1740-domain-containing protein [Xylariaceae sp. FL0662B]|nr:DUF1740-domain-containing protein [Xylariaceae sp. FL0662B]